MAVTMAQTGSKSKKAGKRKSGGTKKTEPKTPPKSAQATMAKVLAHPTRLQILAVAHQRAISPSEFGRAHGLTTSNASHHFKKLVDYGAIKLVREEPVHGSVRHMYVGTKRAIFTETEWPTLPESIQTGLAAATLDDFVNVAARAIDIGTFTAREDFVFTWDEAKLDEIAWKKLGKMLRLVWQKVPSLEEETATRKRGTGGKPVRTVVGLAAFEAPAPEPPAGSRKKRA
jgi:DNA-binding transcriptional ArsR family regulator